VFPLRVEAQATVKVLFKVVAQVTAIVQATVSFQETTTSFKFAVQVELILFVETSPVNSEAQVTSKFQPIVASQEVVKEAQEIAQSTVKELFI